MLLVVRQHQCNRYILKDTIRQLEFIGTKILGVVHNCITEHRGKYGRGYYGGYYGNYYGRPYGRTQNKYEAAAAKPQNTDKPKQ